MPPAAVRSAAAGGCACSGRRGTDPGEAAHEQTPGTAEAKIKALYDCVMDTDVREKAGVAPIQKYLDAIENAATLNELVAADVTMQQELGLSTLLGFGLTADLADPSRKTTAFSLIGAGMGKDFYTNGTDAQKAAYSTYLTTLLTLSGLSGDEAARRAALAYVDEYFSAAAKADVEEMIGEFISIYKERILAQDRMSAETKGPGREEAGQHGRQGGLPRQLGHLSGPRGDLVPRAGRLLLLQRDRYPEGRQGRDTGPPERRAGQEGMDHDPLHGECLL